MEEIKKFGIFSSSVDPEKISLTVHGLIIAASSAIIFGVHLLGINIGAPEISQLATQLGAAVGSLVFFTGVIRKFIVKYSAKASVAQQQQG